MKITPTLRFLLVAVIGTGAVAGCESEPKDGTVVCSSSGQACPDGYHCVADNTCWKNGHDPVAPAPDGGTPQDGQDVIFDVGSRKDGGDAEKPIDMGPAIDTQLGPDSSGVAFDGPAPDLPAFDVFVGPDSPLDLLPAPDSASEVDVAPDAPATDALHCASGKKPCGDTCIDASACCTASDCTTLCTTCGSSNTCVPLVGDDPTMRCTGTCDSTGACKSKLGQACTSVGGGCASSTFCAPEGICCDKACASSCEACDLSGSVGTCKTLAAGTAPRTTNGHAACVTTDAACAGKCDGTNPACTYSTASCGTATCTGQVFQAAGNCSTGVCNLPAPETCTNACVVATGCSGVCTPDSLQCKNTTTPQKCSTTGSWVDQTACSGGLTCKDGACACQSPNTTCPAGCVDLQTDASNCGKCGQSCGAGSTCSAGKCQVVSVTTALDPNPTIIGLDGSYLYFVTNQTQSSGQNAYRVSRTAAAVAGSLMYAGGGVETINGVISTKLVTTDGYPKFICDVSGSNACTSRTQVDYLSDYAKVVPWRHYPEPTYFAAYDISGLIPLEVAWGSPVIPAVRAAQSFDTVGDYYRSFMASGNYVYWIRTSGSANVLFSSSSSAGGNISQLATGLTDSIMIVDANPKSILLWDIGGTGSGALTRLAVGATGTPTAVVSLATAPSLLKTTEDAAGVYYFDADGNLFRCPSTGCTTGAKIQIAESQQPNGPLYQDSTYLYWGNASPAAIRRVAKPLP
jgi:hypothetical protein